MESYSWKTRSNEIEMLVEKIERTEFTEVGLKINGEITADAKLHYVWMTVVADGQQIKIPNRIAAKIKEQAERECGNPFNIPETCFGRKR